MRKLGAATSHSEQGSRLTTSFREAFYDLARTPKQHNSRSEKPPCQDWPGGGVWVKCCRRVPGSAAPWLELCSAASPARVLGIHFKADVFQPVARIRSFNLIITLGFLAQCVGSAEKGSGIFGSTQGPSLGRVFSCWGRYDVGGVRAGTVVVFFFSAAAAAPPAAGGNGSGIGSGSGISSGQRSQQQWQLQLDQYLPWNLPQ